MLLNLELVNVFDKPIIVDILQRLRMCDEKITSTYNVKCKRSNNILEHIPLAGRVVHDNKITGRVNVSSSGGRGGSFPPKRKREEVGGSMYNIFVLQCK